MEQMMSAHRAARREAPLALPSLGGHWASDPATMLSTDVQSGLPLPRYLHSAEHADAADGPRFDGGSKDSLPYRPGEMLKKSASIVAESVDPLTLPRLLGAGSSAITTQAAKGAKCAAAVIAACSAAAASVPAATETPAECQSGEPRAPRGRLPPIVADAGEAAPTKPQPQPRQLQQPRLGSAELPTRGSAAHRLGLCKPCAFVFTAGCQSGAECRFCHLCEPGEKKRRKKERKEIRRMARCTARGAVVAPDAAAPAADHDSAPPPPCAAAASAAGPGAVPGSSTCCTASADATTAAAEGARRAAAIIAASFAPLHEAGAIPGEPEERGAGSVACSSRSTADTEDLQELRQLQAEEEAAEEEGDFSRQASLQDQDCGDSAAPPTPSWYAAAGGAGAGAGEAGGGGGWGAEQQAWPRLPPAVQSLASSVASPAGEAVTLKLEDAVAAPKLGSASLPTVGSAFHNLGTCKPCAFAFSGRCQSGVDCKFCHLCEPGEKNRRKKERKQMRRMVWF